MRKRGQIEKLNRLQLVGNKSYLQQRRAVQEAIKMPMGSGRAEYCGSGGIRDNAKNENKVVL